MARVARASRRAWPSASRRASCATDGLYHVYDRHAHAWPEVWFDGFGWVSFEPTPGRGEPGAESHTGVAAAQDATAAATGGGDGGEAAQASATTAAPVVERPVNPEAGANTTTTSVVPRRGRGQLGRRQRHRVDDRAGRRRPDQRMAAVDAARGPQLAASPLATRLPIG